VLIQDTEATIARLAQLKGLGVRVAIDDFGTGCSSLSYLRQLPVDILKVDKSFIDGVQESPEASAVARAIIRLGRTLSLQTVAEGIEEPTQLDALRKMQCDLGQGYVFAKPLTSAELEEVLSATQPRGHSGATRRPSAQERRRQADDQQIQPRSRKNRPGIS
jgi:EAL domain-containing protein (putative c-di-GMP-specific phosphodiesterase class I)